ncbi:MAG: 4Fe-4S dicluster domain-containing protein [Bacteroidota bacterium]
MKYGFIIDNRKCIGCHACTVACKSEHDVPVGVNRTWVKQVEKGQFPHTQRLFSVMRCNHCTDAPCVTICPVEALHKREDGIVDFDSDRCIGCKACMQACPYDALYIDPDTHTAAKCNYCAHRVDVGLEPACVNVCPEHAIISGDMEDPFSEISTMLSQEKVTVRKPEKDTKPNLFYINGDEASLTPTHTQEEDQYMWSEQTGGVGHFAKYAENRKQQANPAEMSAKLAGGKDGSKTQVQAIMEKTRRVYDAPRKGTLWGWEVSAYVWTKAIATGALLVPFMASVSGLANLGTALQWSAVIVGMLFLAITGGLLIKDLDQPSRFLYILLRPQWKSWLVRGGYAITFYGLALTIWAIGLWSESQVMSSIGLWLGALLGGITSVYTAFLFAQAKGRDFWQSPMLSFHMLIHSFMAGGAVFAILGMLGIGESDWLVFVPRLLMLCIGLNLAVILVELTTPHATADAKLTVKMITSGQYKHQFWIGLVGLGNLIPMVLLITGIPILIALAAICVLIGIYVSEHIWVQAPQQIPLS